MMPYSTSSAVDSWAATEYYKQMMPYSISSGYYEQTMASSEYYKQTMSEKQTMASYKGENGTAGCLSIYYVKTTVKNIIDYKLQTYCNTTITRNTWKNFICPPAEPFERDRWEEYGGPLPVQKTPQERLREMLQQRQVPGIVIARSPILAPHDTREIRARETLRLCLGEEVFRSFLKNGFVSVRGKSGLVYQIFPGHGVTRVYKNGQMVERLCVVFQGDFPPADSLVMRFLLILNDEDEFRHHAVKHSVVESNRTRIVAVDDRNLVQMFREFKAAKAA